MQAKAAALADAPCWSSPFASECGLWGVSDSSRVERVHHEGHKAVIFQNLLLSRVGQPQSPGRIPSGASQA